MHALSRDSYNMAREYLSLTLRDLNELGKLAEIFWRTLLEYNLSEEELIIGLIGELGVGKTTFLKAILGKEIVFSPSFIILNVYNYSNLKVYHWDLYRLRGSPQEVLYQIEELGFWELLIQRGFTFVEWYDRIADAEQLESYPKVLLNFSFGDPENVRIVHISTENLSPLWLESIEERVLKEFP